MANSWKVPNLAVVHDFRSGFHCTLPMAANSLERTYDRVHFGNMFQYELLFCVNLTANSNVDVSSVFSPKYGEAYGTEPYSSVAPCFVVLNMAENSFESSGKCFWNWSSPHE